jgi:hypothetical protein
MPLPARVSGREDLARAIGDSLDRLVCLLDGGCPDRVHRCPELIDLGAAEGWP